MELNYLVDAMMPVLLFPVRRGRLCGFAQKKSSVNLLRGGMQEQQCLFGSVVHALANMIDKYVRDKVTFTRDQSILHNKLQIAVFVFAQRQ